MQAEQFSALARLAVATQLMATTAASHAGFHGISKLTHLNASLARTSIQEAGVIWKAMLASADPGEASRLLAAQWQPNAAKAIAYGRHIADISAAVQQELQLATERQLSYSRHQVDKIAQDADGISPNEVQAWQAYGDLLDNGRERFEQGAEAVNRGHQALRGTLDSAFEKWIETATASWPGTDSRSRSGAQR